MLFHDVRFFVCQFAGFEQDAIWNAQFADIVQ